MSSERRSRIQRLVFAFTPKSWHAGMEAESRQWVLRCPCGSERTIWELGGIRYKSSRGGKTATFGRCTACGQRTWQTLHYRPDDGTSAPG